MKQRGNARWHAAGREVRAGVGRFTFHGSMTSPLSA
jgi:hypothetical protein